MKHKVILIFLLITYLASIRVFASPAKDEDFGIWSQNDIETKVSKNIKMKVGEELRFREHAGLSYYDTHAGIFWQTAKYLVLGADYLQARQTRVKGKKDVWYWEERPRIYATPQMEIKGFKFENRNLLEFRIKEEADNTLRYRNMTTMTTPWKLTRFEFQPYATNELFFETDRIGLVEDRIYGGLRLHIWRGLGGSVYYLRQYTKNSAAVWRESNILGLALKVVI